jgi:hypothetical protein
MKRFFAVMAIAAIVSLGAYSQTSLAAFQSGFESFAGDMAGSLAVNSTIGANWSDAYIGGFPHLGVGLTGGAAFVSSSGTKSLFDAMGQPVPSALSKVGVPIPAAVATLKIGIPFLPMDLGVKAGYIPQSVGKNLISGGNVDYTNAGLQLRYDLVKQNLLLPNVSIGAAYNYQKGSVKAPSGIGSQNLTYGSGPSLYTVTMSNPDLNLGWTSNTVDFTAQVSKKLLFVFVPYAGAGLTMGKSSVTGGLDSNITVKDSSGNPVPVSTLIAAMGSAAPDFSNTGFSYTANESKPIFRVYGGLSFRLIILDIDAQAMYVPSQKALGGSITGRVQF